MERDASIVGRTRLLAELIGEVINGFVEPITWRTLVCLPNYNRNVMADCF